MLWFPDLRLRPFPLALFLLRFFPLPRWAALRILKPLLFERNAESFQAVGDGGAEIGDGLEGLGAGSEAGVNAFHGEELRFEVRLGNMDARIERDGERLLHHRAIADEKDFVLAGNGEGAESLLARRVTGERVVGDGVLDVIKQRAVIAEIQGLWRIVAQIPNERSEER